MADEGRCRTAHARSPRLARGRDDESTRGDAGAGESYSDVILRGEDGEGAFAPRVRIATPLLRHALEPRASREPEGRRSCDIPQRGGGMQGWHSAPMTAEWRSGLGRRPESPGVRGDVNLR
jgi:hypothetical protein